MTTLREAAQIALEAMEMLAQPVKTNNETPRYKAHRAAITALRTALAEPEQEPVAWAMPCPDGQIVDVITPEEHAREEGGYTVPLYTEFVCSTVMCRYRKPLTDEQILEVARDHYNPHQRAEISFARAIERAHGITGEQA
jgi:hypothetical protein